MEDVWIHIAQNSWWWPSLEYHRGVPVFGGTLLPNPPYWKYVHPVILMRNLAVKVWDIGRGRLHHLNNDSPRKDAMFHQVLKPCEEGLTNPSTCRIWRFYPDAVGFLCNTLERDSASYPILNNVRNSNSCLSAGYEISSWRRNFTRSAIWLPYQGIIRIRFF